MRFSSVVSRRTAIMVVSVVVTGLWAASASRAKTLAVPQVSQLLPEAYTNWCWAATSEMILRYTQNAPGMCAIANWARERNSWGDDDCCTNGTGSICNQPNWLYGGDGGSIEDILENWGADSETYSQALVLDDLREAIEDDSPVVVRWGWTAGGGHFVVAYGLTDSTVNVRDPWTGTSTMSYSALRSTPDRTWTHSLIVVPQKVTYVVDDTGSMGEEIASVRTTLLDKIGAFESEGRFVKYSLITYKDVPTFVGSTVDHDEIANLVGGLTASGGGDCPEDGYGALDLAADKAPDSEIWWMTDADSHGGFLRMFQTRTRLSLVGCTLHSTVLGSCSGSTSIFSSQEDSQAHGLAIRHTSLAALGNVDAFTAGETLAAGTGGLSFAIGSGDISAATAIVLEEMSSTAILLRRHFTAGSRTTEVPVDPSVEALKVVLDLPAGATGSLAVEAPDGTPLLPGDPGVETISAGATEMLIVTLPALVSGTYTVETGGDSDYGLSVSASSPHAVGLVSDTTVGVGTPFRLALDVPSVKDMTGLGGPGDDGPGGAIDPIAPPPLDLPFELADFRFFLESWDGSERVFLDLFDDGLHDDGGAADGIFGGVAEVGAGGRYRFGVTDDDGFERVTKLTILASTVLVESPADVVANPGDTVVQTFTVTSIAAGTLTLDLGVGSSGGWEDGSAVPASITLGPGESTTVSVPVTVPPSVLAGESSELSLVVVAIDDPDVNAAGSSTTTAWVGPLLSSLSPASVRHGEILALFGSGFGDDPGTGGRDTDTHHVAIAGLRIADQNVLSWSDILIEVEIPTGTPSGLVHVVAAGLETNSLNLVVVPVTARLDPRRALVPPGTMHLLTVELFDETGSPAPHVPVTFSVASGPNVGASESGITDSAGIATASFTSTVTGADRIEVSFTDPVSSAPTTEIAHAFWDFDCDFNGIADTCDIDCGGFDGACVAYSDCGGSADLDADGKPDVCGNFSVVDVPTASDVGLLFLVLLLAAAGLMALRP